MKHSKVRRNICLIIAILLILGFIVPVLISSAATPRESIAGNSTTVTSSLNQTA